MAITSLGNQGISASKSNTISGSKFKGFTCEYLVIGGGGGGGSGEANTRAGGS